MNARTIIIVLLTFLPFYCHGQGALALSVIGYAPHCNGTLTGSAKVNATGGHAPYTYRWAPVSATLDSVSGLAAGTYSITVTDSTGTSALATITISQPPPLLVTIDSNILQPCFRTSSGGACSVDNTLWAVVSGGTPPYSYLWTPSGCTTDTLSYANYSTYSVEVTDIQNCLTSDSIDVLVPVTIHFSSATQQISAQAGMILYPVPAGNQLFIRIYDAAPMPVNIDICNITGKKILELSGVSPENMAPIDVAKLPVGTYLLQCSNNQFTGQEHFTIAR